MLYVTSTRVMDTSGRRHGGLLGGDDFAAYRAELEGPATLDYHGYTVCKTGPWGQGPVFSSNSLCSMGSISSVWATTPSNTSTPSSAPSSRLPTGLPPTVTQGS